MNVSRKWFAAGLTLLFAAASMAFTLSASGQAVGGGRTIFHSTLAPGKTADPPIHGVAQPGADWFLDRGSVRLKSNGRIRVRVDDLVLASGSSGPVDAIRAALFCGNDTSTVPAAVSDPAPIDNDGDARIRDRLTLPASCLAPVVLIKPIIDSTEPNNYIAVTGFRS
jgi:hypothetical protein